MITSARPAIEGGSHWYFPDGRPCFEVMGKQGKPVKTTLKHAKELSLLPSVTTVLKCAARPELEAWKMEQLALAILTTPRDALESDDEFAHRVINQDAKQEASQAADMGSAIHESIADAIRYNGSYGEDGYTGNHAEYVRPILFWLGTRRLYAAEEIVVGKGYAGTVDLRTSCDTIPDYCDIFDFKVTGTIPAKPYPEHRLQLAAYAAALEDQKTCTVHNAYNVYIDRSNPGIFSVQSIGSWLRVYNQGFKPLLEYWVWKNYEQTIKV